MKRDDSETNLGYFKKYPAPVWEAICRENPCESINATSCHYSTMLYAMACAIPAFNVLEIGVADGWCSGLLAHAVKQNNIRFGMSGRYIGIDVDNKDHLLPAYQEKELPVTFIHHQKGSVDYLRRYPFPNEFFDLIFIDGLHQNEYLWEEIRLVYPMLKSKGAGYLCLHDVYAFVEATWPVVTTMMAPDAEGKRRPAWEYLRFSENYGFGILRKMEGASYELRNEYPDQTDYALAQGVINERKEVL